MSKRNWLYIAWIQALLATAVSLFLSDGLGWMPCVLCWYQRTMMYPMVIVLGAAILKDIEGIEFIALPMSLIGLVVSVYHNLLQYGVIPESLGPCTNGVSCTIPYHFYFTWLTVPLLSFAGFAVITISIIMYRKAKV